MNKYALQMLTMISLLGENAYMPQFNKVNEIEVLNTCPKCGREYEKFRGDDVPKYCTDCKTRLWVK